MNYIDVNRCIDKSDINCLETINEKNPEIFFHEYNGNYESALHYTAAYGTKIVLDWLHNKKDFDINFCDKGYETALGSAATKSNIETTIWLIEHGAEIDGIGKNLLSPLMAAVYGNNIDIVKLLVAKGANVNRMHVRNGLLPLDISKSRGYDEISDILIANGAKSHHTLPEWVDGNVKGSGILEHVTLRLGKILPVNIPSKIDTSPVVLKMVPVNNKKNRVLFTFGLFEFHKPMLELFIVLPEYWNFYDQSASNQFPIIFLSKLVEEIKSGRKLVEGDYLLREEKAFEGIEWPPGVAGLFISDVTWKSSRNADQVDKKIEKDEKVFLLTLIPIRATTSGYSKMSLEKSRAAGWAKLTLNV
jgi:hypothetical protein